MDQTSDQIERHIRETRSDLDDNFGELQQKAKTALDWRAHVEERPGTMLALAFGGGIVLSAILSPGRVSRRTYDQEWKRSRNRDLPRPIPLNTPSSAESNETPSTIEALTGALTSLAVSRMSTFISSLLPGFEREFNRTTQNDPTHRPDSDNIPKSGQSKSAVSGAD